MRCLLFLSLFASIEIEANSHEGRAAEAQFALPAVGSYALDRILRAPEGSVLDNRRHQQKLSQYTKEKITLLSLMYTACSDEKGCPFALVTLSAIKRELDRRTSAREHVRLVSLSFDPEHDSPEVMRAYGGSKASARGARREVPWHFLTTASAQQIEPVLAGFDQDVSVPVAATRRKQREMKHLLKVFLIDREGWVREIYSTAYLIPKVVINDIETLLLEEKRKRN